MRIIAALIVSMVCLTSCTDAEWERQTALGNKHKVTMYSGGKAVGVWTSTGCPRSVGNEDGWTFVDADTKHLITVTGDCVIEKLPE